MYGDGLIGFVEEHAVTANAEAEQSLKLAAERLNIALSGLSIAMQALEQMQSGSALDRADFGRNVGTKLNRLHTTTDRACSFRSAPL